MAELSYVLSSPMKCTGPCVGHVHLTNDMFLEALPGILQALPADWRGTTFNNSNLLGRDAFASNLGHLIVKKKESGEKITEDDLTAVGNAEDYLRVATNLSTTLEVALALARDLDVSQVVTFASKAMPIVSVCLAAKRPVHLYTGDQPAVFNAAQQDLLKKLGCHFTPQQHHGCCTHPKDDIVLSLAGVTNDPEVLKNIDGIVSEHVIYITNPKKIVPADIAVMRKRMATPVTTPYAEAWLQKLAGVSVTANLEKPDPAGVAGFYAHLQTLSGTAVNTDCNPVVFTAGLPAIASLWVTLVGRGGADILMCSTAYGGSSQLTDIVNTTTHLLHKHVFHIQGSASIVPSVKAELDALAADPSKLMPTTVLFMEIPTNPDMKVPKMEELAELLGAYKTKTGKDVLMLVDTTFAPGSKIMEKLNVVAPDLNVIVFCSLSKSVSRGLTTAGTLVANHTPTSKAILLEVAETAKMLDTAAKDDQLVILSNNHTGVEERCAKAYEVAVAAGDALVSAVKTARQHDMSLAFVKPEHAAQGLTSSTFSFNLPPPEGATEEINAALAQKFVDLLTVNKGFKPCVSFGQDNGLVYCTVPATSTQGAIKAEDKAKQAVGGVQLVRLSFPPTCDVPFVTKVLSESVAALYQ